jgi:putative CocE/NonD family hydrolase
MRVVLVLSALVLLVTPLPAQSTAQPSPTYTRKEVMIPMRDGVKLHAVVLRAAPGSAHANEALPILMVRTPYGVSTLTPESFANAYPEIAAAGYIFVNQDIRGRYGSEGSFVMMRPLAAHHDARLYPQDVDESTDAYDSIAWLVEHLPHNNGRVGVFGVSYDGFLAAMAGIDPHPAVKAISPQAPMTDVWRGDDFFHNGAFREAYGYDYALGMETSKETAFGRLNEDAYTYFLHAGSFAEAIKESGLPVLPTWQAFLEHPSYDAYWQRRAVDPHLNQAPVPTLEVGGYWDQEDMWGPQAEYAALKQHDSHHQVFLALGPWNHGQWREEASTLGPLDFAQATGIAYRERVEEPFFEHYLRPERSGTQPFPGTVSFQTGTNRWMHYADWPPSEHVQTRALYLEPQGGLSFAAPEQGSTKSEAARMLPKADATRDAQKPGAAKDVANPEGTSDLPKPEATAYVSGPDAIEPVSDAEATRYVSDPAHPVPYRARPIEATYAPTGSHWSTWLAEDQRPAAARTDVATWKTPALDHPVTITGVVGADLYASTTGTDSDWVVKLIDVYPDDSSQGDMAGYQLMIAAEIFRGRYQAGFTEPRALPAGTVEEYKFSLNGADHVFLKGHRLMVQVQSSWFPLYDRNPQTFVPNIMAAKPSAYHAATQRIFHSAEYPSHLSLPVMLDQP